MTVFDLAKSFARFKQLLSCCWDNLRQNIKFIQKILDRILGPRHCVTEGEPAGQELIRQDGFQLIKLV